MESIKALVQVLVIIIVMGVFIEMLLPSNKMHDYVKMIMGLLVIVVVLEAGADLVKQDFKFDLPALGSGQEGPPLEKIMQDGQQLAGKQKQQAMQEYQQGLEKQVLALAKLQDNLNVTGVKVKTTQNPEDPNYGRLTGIVLEVSGKADNGSEKVPEVNPVEITVEANSSPEGKTGPNKINSDQAKKFAQTVANFYNIPVDQIQVVEK